MEVGTTDNATPTTSTASAVLDAPTVATTEPSALDSLNKVAARADADPSSASPVNEGAAVSAVQPPASATVTPPATVTAKTEEPIPFDRHTRALENARTKAIEEYRAKHGWAESVDPQRARLAMAVLDKLDTEEGARELFDRWQEHVSASDTSDPEPDLVSQDGQHQAYSAAAMKRIVGNVEARVTKAVMEQLQPTVQFATASKDEADKQAIIAKAQTFAKSAYADLEKLPWFKRETHGQPIADALAAMDPAEKAQIGSYAALMKAANTVYINVVHPSLQLQAEASVEADNRKKAAASTGTVNGNGATSHTPIPKRFDHPEDFARHLEKKAASQGVTL